MAPSVNDKGEKSQSNNFTALQLLDQLDSVGRSFFPFIVTRKAIVTIDVVDDLIRASVAKQTFAEFARFMVERRNNWILSRMTLFYHVAEKREKIVLATAARFSNFGSTSAPAAPPSFFTKPGGIEARYAIIWRAYAYLCPLPGFINVGLFPPPPPPLALSLCRACFTKRLL